jgi:UDP-N-acetylglucosamine 2-epimerase (non-hydrolysing)
MEEASVILTGLSSERILQALKIIDRQPRGSSRLLKPVKDYSYDNVSEKIVRIILSYVDYVNINVWKK